MFERLLVVVSAGWVGFELWLLAFRRSGAGTARKDVGTLRRLNVVIYASVAAAVFASRLRPGHLALPPAARWAGLAVILAGLALRLWAIAALDRFFTVDVALHPDHRLVASGPYAVVRHPAYSGVLLSFLGLALCLSSGLSALLLLPPITAVFLHRVRVEERVLGEAFPGEYAAYAARTARLVPGVY